MDPGPCPKVAPIATFDAEKFSGDWYMISFKPNMMESATLRCRLAADCHVRHQEILQGLAYDLVKFTFDISELHLQEFLLLSGR